MRTRSNNVELFHTVPLGEGVAENLSRLLAMYAKRAKVELSILTLEGTTWSRPWSEIEPLEGFGGRIGQPDDCEYDQFILRKPTPGRLAAKESLIGPCPMTLEGVIAHEIVHLRWPELNHGDAFWEKTLALLRAPLASTG